MPTLIGLMLLVSGIHGIVTNADNTPVANAKVILRNDANNQAEYGTLTSADGTFSLKDIAPGRYRLSAEKDGYIGSAYGQRHPDGPAMTLVLSTSAEDREFRLKLTRAGAISGRIVDEDGNPLQGAEILLYRKRIQIGQVNFALTSPVAARTNDLGEYRAFGLSPGTYYVSAMYDDSTIVSGAKTIRVDRSAKKEDYVPTFFPGVDDPASATAIELSAGTDARRVDFMMSRAPQVRIRGKLAGCTYPDSSSISISLSRRAPGIPQLRFRREGRVLDANGSFEVTGVPSGSYQLTALVRQGSWTFFPIEIGTRDMDDLVVPCTPRVELSGSVRMDGDGKIPTPLAIDFLAPDFRSGGTGYGTNVRPDGTFVGRDIAPGLYRVYLRTLPDTVFAKSITAGTRDLLAAGIVFDGPIQDPIQIVLSDKAARIDGTVFEDNQKPAANVKVVLIPEPRLRNRDDLYGFVQTDENGHFQLKGLTPGDYELYAWEYVDSDAYRDPVFLAPFKADAKSIHLDAGSNATADLKLLSASSRR